MVLGPIIPGRPTPAKPAATTPKASNPAPVARYIPSYATPVARYIPSYATPSGKTTKQVTAANNAAVAKGLVPKPTNTLVRTTSKPTTSKPTTTSSRGADVGSSSSTGSIETQTAPETTEGKPIEVVLGQEEMDAVQSAADALRTFQENQTKQQLQAALGKIDRAAIDQYKGIANDYAARGMARSGGFIQTEQRAVADRDRAVNEATQAVTDFINELKLTGNLEQAKTNLSKSQAFQDYINGRLAPATGG